MRARLTVVISAVLLAAACTPAPQAATPTASKTGDRCRGTEILRGTAAFPEVRGTARGAELWGLLFAQPPFTRGQEVKIVWRMTGDGPLAVGAEHADGTRTAPVDGPTAHEGSNWKRPGEEWGTVFVFPKPGCWRLHLRRTAGEGDVWLRVA